ncbi:MAG: hypothetical protein HRU13_09915, partial [Phycisphaerales bacterium]|nr:hypothetical protein [Phycisphaerales bacterium]
MLYHFSARSVLMIAAMLGLLAAAPAALAQTHRAVTFQSDAAGERRAYPAVLSTPAPDADIGAAVLLLGGGYAHDQHWTVPGSVETDAGPLQLTISGEPHEDARVLAEALTNAGFTVFRFGLVHRDDPLAVAQPGMAQQVPMRQGFVIAADALEAFGELAPEACQRLVLVGHSLGAVRSARLIDERARAIVWLAPAYAVPLPGNTRALVARTRELIDSDNPEAQAPPHDDTDFELTDFDGDGTLADWELADRAVRRGLLGETPDGPFLGGPWPIERVEDTGVPVLALFGGLDSITMQAPAIARTLAWCFFIAAIAPAAVAEAPARQTPSSEEQIRAALFGG